MLGQIATQHNEFSHRVVQSAPRFVSLLTQVASKTYFLFWGAFSDCFPPPASLRLLLPPSSDFRSVVRPLLQLTVVLGWREGFF